MRRNWCSGLAFLRGTWANCVTISEYRGKFRISLEILQEICATFGSTGIIYVCCQTNCLIFLLVYICKRFHKWETLGIWKLILGVSSRQQCYDALLQTLETCSFSVFKLLRLNAGTGKRNSCSGRFYFWFCKQTMAKILQSWKFRVGVHVLNSCNVQCKRHCGAVLYCSVYCNCLFNF